MSCCCKKETGNETYIIRKTETSDIVPELTSIIQKISDDAIATRNVFTIGLSGGSLVTQLGEGFPKISTNWSKWRIFFCDERVVNYSSPDSTYGAYKRVFKNTPVSENQIIAIDENVSVTKAAENYARKMEQHFSKDEVPQFDLLLLGLGPDGHTCSLFPGHPACDVTDRWVAPVTKSPKPPPNRITLTFPVINNARSVVFVATGENKAEILKSIFKDSEQLPAAKVKLNSGNKVIWLLDTKAASLL